MGAGNVFRIHLEEVDLTLELVGDDGVVSITAISGGTVIRGAMGPGDAELVAHLFTRAAENARKAVR